MNYEYIENLVSDAKAGSPIAKENLAMEFTPLINSILRKTYIHGYENCDIKQECYFTLFNCIPKYKLGAKCFSAYAANSIKNNVKNLITKNVKRDELDGFASLTLDDILEPFLPHDMLSLDDMLCDSYDRKQLSFVINNKLDDEEKHLISFLFFKNNTLTNYAYYKNISYVTASKRKKNVLAKLKKCFYYNTEVMNYGN